MFSAPCTCGTYTPNSYTHDHEKNITNITNTNIKVSAWLKRKIGQ